MKNKLKLLVVKRAATCIEPDYLHAPNELRAWAWLKPTSGAGLKFGGRVKHIKITI